MANNSVTARVRRLKLLLEAHLRKPKDQQQQKMGKTGKGRNLEGGGNFSQTKLENGGELNRTKNIQQ